MTVHKSQGSTYDYMIGNLTVPDKLKSVQQGLVYTLLSRAKSRQAIKLVDFNPNDIKVNKTALQEMERMTTESPFTWQYTLRLKYPNSSALGHVNIRPLNLHASDLQADDAIQQLSIIMCNRNSYL